MEFHSSAKAHGVAVPIDPIDLYSMDAREGSQGVQAFGNGDIMFLASDVALLEREKPGAGPQLVHSLSDSSIFQGIELQKKSRVLTLSLVLPIYYFLTCGGPAGIEPLVSNAGPLIALTSLIAFPIFFSVPVGLLVSEMCTAFPDDGGFVIWVTNAFGPFWGFQEGFWNWVSTVLNNAVYPGLVLAALPGVTGEIQSKVVAYLIKVAIAIGISLPTLFGTRIVGRISILLLLLVLVPFIVATVWFFSRVESYAVLGEVPGSSSSSSAWQGSWNATSASAGSEGQTVNWSSMIKCLFWSYDSIYLVSLFGGQVANPSYTYPRAIFITLSITVVTYVVPLAAALAVNKVNWRVFHEGSMEQIAQIVGGPSLHHMLVVSAVCSSIGLFTSATFAQCYLVNGMAQQGLIPAMFAKRHYFFETPYLALLLNTLPVLLLLAFDSKELLDAANCLSSASQVLMITAAIKLRIMNGDMYQFRKFPGGNPMVIVSMIVPMAVIGFVFAVSLHYIAAIVVVFGVGYGLFRMKSNC